MIMNWSLPSLDEHGTGKTTCITSSMSMTICASAAFLSLKLLDALLRQSLVNFGRISFIGVKPGNSAAKVFARIAFFVFNGFKGCWG